MKELANIIISSIIALTYLILAYLSGGGEAFIKIMMFLVLPLCAIWFPDILGDLMIIRVFRPSITEKSPGFLVRFLGWILLLLPIALIFISATQY